MADARNQPELKIDIPVSGMDEPILAVETGLPVASNSDPANNPQPSGGTGTAELSAADLAGEPMAVDATGAGYDTDEGEIAGSATDTDSSDAEEKSAYCCPHPRCPSHKKASQRFKKRKEAPAEEPERKTPWGKWLHEYKKSHPELNAFDAKIEARKYYQPKNNKRKSFHRIFAEKWKATNPAWRNIKDPKELDRAIRDAFLAQV